MVFGVPQRVHGVSWDGLESSCEGYVCACVCVYVYVASWGLLGWCMGSPGTVVHMHVYVYVDSCVERQIYDSSLKHSNTLDALGENGGYIRGFNV